MRPNAWSSLYSTSGNWISSQHARRYAAFTFDRNVGSPAPKSLGPASRGAKVAKNSTSSRAIIGLVPARGR